MEKEKKKAFVTEDILKRDIAYRGMEKIPTEVYDDSKAASVAIANEIAKLIRQKEKEKKNCILGLATGSTPIKVYKELARMHKEEGLSFKNVISFNLDEYYPIDSKALQSYHVYMNTYLFDHIDIPKENINLPDGMAPQNKIEEFCKSYEEKIISLGGIDIQLLGIGRDGHIGFNEPGSSKKSKTRLIHLDKITKIDAGGDFFGIENVPKYALTMGVESILNAKRIFIMAYGESKSRIVKKAIEGPITQEIPSTFLQDHSNTSFYLDRAAADLLVRFQCP